MSTKQSEGKLKLIDPFNRGIITAPDAPEPTEAEKKAFAETMLGRVSAADVVILVGTSELPHGAWGASVLLPPGSTFDPNENKSHALAEAFRAEYSSLVRRVAGFPSDSQRYQALRDYALLAKDQEQAARFMEVNRRLTIFEQETGIDPENVDVVLTAEQYDTYTDMLTFAMFDTAAQSFEAGESASVGGGDVGQ